MGAILSNELHNMKILDVEDLGSVLIMVPNTKTEFAKKAKTRVRRIGINKFSAMGKQIVTIITLSKNDKLSDTTCLSLL